ncbi:hypothetical protein KNP414_07034 [Paenibacillus mucilaginosus KNP414]|uniref:Uncharacterized protein n=1 Tax=Paenibacillus mucilaginosus (strain KNP414) TaxID=1036673 RepID=F8FKF3_PAEMK|nr:hypothetical protein KNP414_07034 [Paenibacillus mucilaginosus KNP414]
MILVFLCGSAAAFFEKNGMYFHYTEGGLYRHDPIMKVS